MSAVPRAPEQYPVSPREDARVGLAGPMWGLFAVALAGLCVVSARHATMP